MVIAVGDIAYLLCNTLPLDSSSDLLTGNNAAVISKPILAKQRQKLIAHFGIRPAIYIDAGIKWVIGVDAHAVAIDRHLIGRVNDRDKQMDVVAHK